MIWPNPAAGAQTECDAGSRHDQSSAKEERQNLVAAARRVAVGCRFRAGAARRVGDDGVEPEHAQQQRHHSGDTSITTVNDVPCAID